MSRYQLPNALFKDFTQFRQEFADFKAGKLDALAFKTRRVPFGVYEQRTPDTYMVRVRLAAGTLSPVQLKTLCDIAGTLADVKLHATTRSDVQLHHVKLDNILPIMEQLHAVGLSSRGGGGNTVRNITADALAGIAEDELFDVTPYAAALTTRLIGEADSFALPRKFKIAFSGSTADRAGATLIDVGFIAALQNDQRGFTVYAAGGMGAKTRVGTLLFDFVPAQEAWVVAEAVKRVFDSEGDRKHKHANRLRFLVEQLGFDAFKTRVANEMAGLKQCEGWALQVDETAPVIPAAATPLSPVQPGDGFERFKRRFVLPQKQPGLFCVKVPLDQGDLHRDYALKLTELLAPIGDECFRFGVDQNLYLRHLPDSWLGAVYEAVKPASKLVSRPSIVGDMVTCTGASTCQLGITLPRGASEAIIDRLDKSGLDLDALQGFKIHLSGCPNSCGRHWIGDLGFYGKIARKNGFAYPAYNVVAGARVQAGRTRFGLKAGEVAAFHLPAFIEAALKSWLTTGQKDFAAWIDAGGADTLTQLSAAYADVPDFAQDKNPYFDHGATKLFSTKDRGTGECSAGMYDLIEADKKAIEAQLQTLQTDEAVANLALLSARMLLIARGDEARDAVSVFKAFKIHFIDTGLAENRFTPLLQKTLTLADADEVQALAAAVLALYGRMDHTLKFAGEVKEAPKSFATVQQKDFRGVGCPMNFVKTKMVLAQMKGGEVLEILLDDGAPIDNVPRSVASEGHTVEEQKREGAGWRVRIRKK